MMEIELQPDAQEELSNLTSAAEMVRQCKHSKAKLDKWVAGIVEKLPLKDLMERSTFRSLRLILKVLSVAVLGTSIALSTDSLIFRGIGIMLLAVAMSWADLISEECRQIRFFPSLQLNKFFGILFRWEVAAIIFGTLYCMAVSGVSSLRFLDAAAIGQFWAMPFLLMRLNRYAIMWNQDTDDMQSTRLISAPNHKGPFLFPQFHEILTMVLESIDLGPSYGDSNDDTKSQLSEGAVVARQTVARCVAQAVDVPVYNLNQLSRSAADALTEALTKVRFVDEESENSMSSDEELEIPAPDPKKLKRKVKNPASVQKWILRSITSPLRFITREALLWERRDFPLYCCMITILALFYFGVGHWSWLILIAFSPLLGPKSVAAIALRDLQNELGKMYTPHAKSDEIVRPPWWSVISVPMCFYMALIHCLGLMGLWAMVSPASWTELTGVQAPTRFSILLALILWPITGFGITGGSHRLWAHRSYQANFGVRLVLMIVASMANQGSIFHWARDHRVHHLYSDSEKDPYNARRGFFFCHIGWLLMQKNKEVVEAGKQLDLSDLLADPLIMIQKRYDPIWNLWWCFGFPAVLAYMVGDSWINGLLIPGAFRYMWVLHCTWCVNSVVHTIGDTKPYAPNHATTESGLVSFLAVGEGWHNWHHAYPFDYAAAELDWFRQYNPTKMVIDIWAWFGWVWGRKRGLHHWSNRKKKWEEKYGENPVQGLKGVPPFQHREVDYEMFDQQPRLPKADNSIPALTEENIESSPKVLKRKRKAHRQARCSCTRIGAARCVISGGAALAVAAGAVAQGFANSYFGVNEYLCLTSFTIFAVLVAGYDFFSS
jgi:stearoyl-CoA desaturase (delta-9 desaturase)